jgi:SAM-dependent methyltransferase
MRDEEFRYLYELEERFWWFRGMRAIAAALLAPLRPALRGARVADVGCGTGYMLGWLAEWTGQPVVGLDYASAGLALARDRGASLLVRGSAAALPFPAASFDLVTTFEVLDELPDDRPGFAEIARVLVPGGHALVRLPALELLRSRHDRAMHTARRTTVGALAAKLAAHGLRVERATYANTLLFPPIAAVRLARRFLPGEGARGSDVRPLPPALGWLEDLLAGCLRAEARFLARPGAALPIGVSALCLARKPAAARSIY